MYSKATVLEGGATGVLGLIAAGRGVVTRAGGGVFICALDLPQQLMILLGPVE